MDDKKVIKSKKHNIILENREKLNISGVIEVDSFNEENVIMDTELGLLVVRGEELHINKLNIDDSEICIEGNIISFEYSDSEGGTSKGTGFFAKMFK